MALSSGKRTFSLLLTAASVFLLSALTQTTPAFAVSPQLDCEAATQAYAQQGIPCYCRNGQIICNEPSGKLKSKSGYNNFNTMVAGMVFESLLTSIFADNTAGEKEMEAAKQQAAAIAAMQAAANKKIQEAKAQAEYEKMMRSYKPLGDSQGAAFKTLANTALSLKTLEGSDESLAAGARKPFDTASEMKEPPPDSKDGATPFFGDTMPIEDIRLLVNPENDPRVVDLRKAENFVVANIKNDGAKLSGATKKYKQDIGGPIIAKPDCVKLSKKLQGFITQREKFQKTVTMAREQIDTWETANRNALMNAVKDGIDYFTGELLEGAARRGKAAERLEEIYRKNAKRMMQEGIDIIAVEAKIKRLKALSATGRIAELTGNIKDWQGFIKDGVSGLVSQLTASNQEIKAMMEEPQMRKYFETESPELKALLDITKIAAANQVFGKWLAKKIPVIAGVELAINQTYNATDWLLSLQRIDQANEVNGQVANAARLLQKNINDTYLELQDCR